MGLPLELTGTLLTARGGGRLLLVGEAVYVLVDAGAPALAGLPDGARVRVSAVLLPPTDAEGAPARVAVRRVLAPEPAAGEP